MWKSFVLIGDICLSVHILSRLRCALTAVGRQNIFPANTHTHKINWKTTTTTSDHRKRTSDHDDVIKWKHFPRYWPFVREIHRSPVNFPHKGQWRGALMFALIRVWINGWVNNREAGDLRRHLAHYDVIVMDERGRWQLPLRCVVKQSGYDETQEKSDYCKDIEIYHGSIIHWLTKRIELSGTNIVNTCWAE